MTDWMLGGAIACKLPFCAVLVGDYNSKLLTRYWEAE
jgi:hypothetical protein